MSGPDTWVTERTGHMGDTPGRKSFSCKPERLKRARLGLEILGVGPGKMLEHNPPFT
jgi:hypothetical protein